MQGTPGTEGSSVGTQQTQPQPQQQLGSPPLPGIAMAATNRGMDMDGSHGPASQFFHHAELRPPSGSIESEEGRQVKRLRQQQDPGSNAAGVSLALHAHTVVALVSQLVPLTWLECSVNLSAVHGFALMPTS